MRRPEQRRPAAFLDRDGTINREVQYLSHPDQLELLPGVGPALRRLREAGYLLVVVTNQSGIARGYFSDADLEAIHRRLAEQLAAHDVVLDAIYYSAAHPDDGDPCRKPGTGMITRAARELGIDLARSWMVGDKTVDVLTGRNAGLRTVLVKTGYGGTDGAFDVAPDAVVDDLLGAADVILA
jgi:D-glycero-D-manno-heptose 1,7-bisphosphate phosphatase